VVVGWSFIKPEKHLDYFMFTADVCQVTSRRHPGSRRGGETCDLHLCKSQVSESTMLILIYPVSILSHIPILWTVARSVRNSGS
jgi:hypothetical protein